MATFPGATHTFNVQRSGGTVLSGNNYIPAPSVIAVAGVSVQLKPLLGVEQVLESGIDAEGKYIGSTFTGTAIKNQDVLLDSVNVNNDGSPVSYTVNESYDNGVYLRLFLHKKAIGG
jgi:hypothetical protein